MNNYDLPVGNRPAPIKFPHFPTQWQAVIWRNWGIVLPEKIASVLHCTVKTLRQAAADMGLNEYPDTNPKWISQGYLTIIRNNWHLLPYSQLLQLLDWSVEKMAYTLNEEDFFWYKVGQNKPECQEVLYTPLSQKEREDTAVLKQTLHRFFLSDEMEYMDQPFSFFDRFAPVSQQTGPSKFEFNFIHSYCASCGDVIGNANIVDPVPENLLAQYASMGIKGVWMHAILYKLYPIEGAEEFSEGHEKRLLNLRNIVERCAKYGIKVYLYLNEPRCMPISFYSKKPHWGGKDILGQNTKTICTTRSPEPLAWLENTMKKLFTDVPGLGGIFCITASENPTNCHYDLRNVDCPSCKHVLPEKIIADIITAMERGMHAAAPSARMIAFVWAWKRNPKDKNPAQFKKAVLDLLPKSVYVNSVSEWGMITHIGGVEQYLVDYSISQVGPSDESLATWNYAQKIGLPTCAKVQINNSWELSAVPYIPVPYLIQEHLNNLKKAGVNGLMLSWTLGGFPGGNLNLLNSSPEEIAASKFHPAVAQAVCNAWQKFSDAFRQFPFHVHVLYRAPMNYGPMNLLHLTPTHYNASMIGFPYDDLKGWCGVYPEDTFETQFKLVTDGWKDGLDILENIRLQILPEEEIEFKEQYTLAMAAYCHLYSTLMQIRFVRARNNGFDKKIMCQCVKEEIKTVLKLYRIIREDSRIGFEASNHYFYTLNDLREKVISCAYILHKFS